jgi:hypothetical protein
MANCPCSTTVLAPLFGCTEYHEGAPAANIDSPVERLAGSGAKATPHGPLHLRHSTLRNPASNRLSDMHTQHATYGVTTRSVVSAGEPMARLAGFGQVQVNVGDCPIRAMMTAERNVFLGGGQWRERSACCFPAASFCRPSRSTFPRACLVACGESRERPFSWKISALPKQPQSSQSSRASPRCRDILGLSLAALCHITKLGSWCGWRQPRHAPPGCGVGLTDFQARQLGMLLTTGLRVAVSVSFPS